MILKTCKKHGETPHSIGAGDGPPRCRKCSVEYVAVRKKKIKLQAIEYKGGKCIKCGYDKCRAALSFHHRDPSQKEFNIGEQAYQKNWEIIKKELDKCDLLCMNCHFELHCNDFLTSAGTG